LTEGAHVRALILEVDLAKRKISFSIKPSRLPDEDDAMSEDAGPTLTTLLQGGSDVDEGDEDVEIDLGLDEMAVDEESGDDDAVMASVVPRKVRAAVFLRRRSC
jgi:rRNA biogenesis protein RRP5